jgi:hypothetical protein
VHVPHGWPALTPLHADTGFPPIPKLESRHSKDTPLEEKYAHVLTPLIIAQRPGPLDRKAHESTAAEAIIPKFSEIVHTSPHGVPVVVCATVIVLVDVDVNVVVGAIVVVDVIVVVGATVVVDVIVVVGATVVVVVVVGAIVVVGATVVVDVIVLVDVVVGNSLTQLNVAVVSVQTQVGSTSVHEPHESPAVNPLHTVSAPIMLQSIGTPSKLKYAQASVLPTSAQTPGPELITAQAVTGPDRGQPTPHVGDVEVAVEVKVDVIVNVGVFVVVVVAATVVVVGSEVVVVRMLVVVRVLVEVGKLVVVEVEVKVGVFVGVDVEVGATVVAGVDVVAHRTHTSVTSVISPMESRAIEAANEQQVSPVKASDTSVQQSAPATKTCGSPHWTEVVVSHDTA